jgi:Uma2 family endonuclease
VNPPAGADSSSGNLEINFQLMAWWKEHGQGRVFDSSAGFFLPDGSSLSPDGAYATAEQMRGFTKEDRKHFLHVTPSFVIELLSFSDSLPAARKKMESWMANGAQLAWLIDPYNRNVSIFEAGQPVRIETASLIAATGPVAGFVLDLAAVWGLYED